MIRGKEKILEFIRLNGLVYYQLRTSPDKDSFSFQSDREETPTEREKRFADVLDTLDPGRYYVEGWKTEKQTKNWYRDYILIENSNFNTIGATPAAINPYDKDYIDRRITEAVEFERIRMRAELLEKELKEANDYIKELETSDTVNSPLDNIIGKITPYIPTFISSFTKTPAAAAVAGIEYNYTPSPNPGITDYPDIDRLTAVCKRLERHAPDYMSLLEWAANQLDANPAMIEIVNNYVKMSKNTADVRS